jgi:hypothetical protein
MQIFFLVAAMRRVDAAVVIAAPIAITMLLIDSFASLWQTAQYYGQKLFWVLMAPALSSTHTSLLWDHDAEIFGTMVPTVWRSRKASRYHGND